MTYRKTTRIALANATIVFAIALSANAQAQQPPTITPPSPIGVWLDHTGRGAVEIRECEKGLCGHVVWIKDQKNKEGCGLQIIGGGRHVGNGRWDGGWIFDPDENSKFDVELKPLKSGKLRVLGYAGVKFLSQTMIWTPAPGDLQLCDSPNAKAQKAGPSQKFKTRTNQSRNPERSNRAEATSTPTISAERQETAPSRHDNKRQNSEPETFKTAEATNRKADIVDDAPPKKSSKKVRTCTLDVPFVKVTFPCPDDLKL